MQVLTIAKDCWYAWQMLPGYAGPGYAPYCSPIFVREVTPRKTGKALLHLKFVNVLYAAGVQDFSMDLRVLKRAAHYLLAELTHDEGDAADRSVIISHIEFEWIRRFCPEIWSHRPLSECVPEARSSVSRYLDVLFFRPAAQS
jgi:hypothetical protein